MKRPVTAPEQVRILGGRYKRSVLPVARGVEGLRPSLARVRQTTFDWLGHDLTGWRVLDAFAGTGALGFEAASRGAASVRMVEQHPAAVAQLQAIRTKLGAQAVEVRRADALVELGAMPSGSLHLVLLDPPFSLSANAHALAPLLAAAARALAPQGMVYLEMDAKAPLDEALAASPSLALHREGRAGAVAFRLLRKAAGA